MPPTKTTTPAPRNWTIPPPVPGICDAWPEETCPDGAIAHQVLTYKDKRSDVAAPRHGRFCARCERNLRRSHNLIVTVHTKGKP